MLYSAEPTVRVRTEPALRLVIATDLLSYALLFQDIEVDLPMMA